MNEKASQAIHKLREYLIGLPRFVKTTIVIMSDLLGLGMCVLSALWLIALGPNASSHALVLVATVLVSLTFAWWLGLYRSVVRFMGLDLLLAGSVMAVGSATVGAVLMNVFVLGGTPRRWAIAYALFSFIYICGSRYFARMFLVDRRAHKHRERVIIFGAGAAGAQLAASLQSGNDYLPVAMLDDDPKLHGKKVNGLEVHSPADIEELCRNCSAKLVLLAVPSARQKIRRQILERLSQFSVRVQTIPNFSDIVSGKARVDDISDVDVKDLLGRDPVPPNPELLGACITEKNVLVTGAGGSIGAELCRQILTLAPNRLVLLEISEAALYSIERELQNIVSRSASSIRITPLLGSVIDNARLKGIVDSFDIHTVYHSAAYKHVPIVEQNVIEGVRNNVLGTVSVANAAAECGVETFVLISTDKAVNPTSVMGATKRLAELVLNAFIDSGQSTRFCIVRFGNVLESSGSVVPLFKQQIRDGGPVTVTHPDIIRYFMTIPEAAQLVIQAGAMARGGDVFVLDMGEPVKILDLAHRMINLMGLTVKDQKNTEGDVEIQFVGLRPAEKLYEELLIGSNVVGTEHPRIMRANEDWLPKDVLARHLEGLGEASRGLDFERAREILQSAVKEYQPHHDIDDLVWLQNRAAGFNASPDTVIEFPGASTVD